MPTLNTLLAVAATTLPLALAQSSTSSDETILGVYLFHRHGDRTSKSTPPTELTGLGYSQVHESGSYFRSLYVASDATRRIVNLNTDIVNLQQLSVSAPADTVLQNSATGFLQGLYPPTASDQSETLRNGSTVSVPLSGYQLVPVTLSTTTGAGSSSEDTTWLQATSNCGAAIASSNNYFSSATYNALLNSTKAFYENLLPVVNRTFTASQMSFKNAYALFDLVNVAEIHNSTIQSDNLLTDDTLFQLRTLADAHEWGLAYNASDDARAIAGRVLAGEVLTALNATLQQESSAPALNIQFGAYASFASFFGLSGLASASNPDLYAVVDYASVMAFELFTPAASSDAHVRFRFHNGTSTAADPPRTYGLFGGAADAGVPWAAFAGNMSSFAVRSTSEWCTACGNTTGVCASATTASTTDDAAGPSESGNGLSPAVNGVIGALVTLAVVLGLQAAVLLVGGWRVVKKQPRVLSTETSKA